MIKYSDRFDDSIFMTGDIQLDCNHQQLQVIIHFGQSFSVKQKSSEYNNFQLCNKVDLKNIE